MWVYNDETDSMIQRDLTFVPGLYKIFDEILGKIYNLLIYASNILCRLRSLVQVWYHKMHVHVL